MEVEAIGRPNVVSSNTQQSSAISQEEFIKLFLAQLSFQDPLEPMDNSEFLAQLAQFSSIAQAADNGEVLQNIAYINNATQGANLLNKIVEVQTPSGLVSVEITAVNFTSEGLRVEGTTVDDGNLIQNIKYSQIVKIINN